MSTGTIGVSSPYHCIALFIRQALRRSSFVLAHAIGMFAAPFITPKSQVTTETNVHIPTTETPSLFRRTDLLPHLRLRLLKSDEAAPGTQPHHARDVEIDREISTCMDHLTSFLLLATASSSSAILLACDAVSMYRSMCEDLRTTAFPSSGRCEGSRLFACNLG